MSNIVMEEVNAPEIPVAYAEASAPATAPWRNVPRVAPYATVAAQSLGRAVPEAGCPTRSPYQRDRDRIVHSSAFRRLTHKTQVFIYHEGDHYRSRLTHSLEVAQVARAMARLLGLDEDLAEAVALAHDLGHPPFGHAGERALDRAMADFGGFDHNAQSLRVVNALEIKYAAFDGLNLSWETLEGIVKHNGPLVASHGDNRTLPATIRDVDAALGLRLTTYASPEAQAAAIADDIAYNNHDIDDGLRAGLITLDMLGEVPLIEGFLSEVRAAHGDLGGKRMIYEINRRLITAMIMDAVKAAETRIAAGELQSVEAVRVANAPTIAFSDAMTADITELRDFLFATVYRDRRVMRIMTDAEAVVADLFAHYFDEPAVLPNTWAARAQAVDGAERALMVCDFVAGMTDRYAIQEHRRLFDATPDLR